MLITYSNAREVLVCTRKTEKNLLNECFAPKARRKLDDYDKHTHEEGFMILDSSIDFYGGSLHEKIDTGNGSFKFSP